MLKEKTIILPFAEVFKTANAAGEVVITLKLLVALTVAPAKAFISLVLALEEIQLLEPFVPSRYKIPDPKFALNKVG